MIRPRSAFLRTLVFGALAGLGYVPLAQGVGHERFAALAGVLYLTVAVATYAWVIGPSRSTRVAASVLLVGFGALSAALFDTLMPTAVLLTLVLGYARGRILFRGRFERPWSVELVLGALAIVAAAVVVERSAEGIGMAIWIYWLVQSAYFLVPGARDAGQRGAPDDPFDRAVGRASDLMDNAP